MKFNINTTAEALEQTGGGNYVDKSGVYEGILQYAQIEKTKNGALRLNFKVEVGGNERVLYGPIVHKTDGQPNDIGMKALSRIAVIAGIEDGSIETEPFETPIGKDQVLTEIDVISGIEDLPVIFRVQEDYSKYNGEIKKALNPASFFRQDGASAAEIVAGSEIGKQLSIEKERYADNVTYRDGLTPEEVAEWKEAQKEGRKHEADAPKAAKTRTSTRRFTRS